MPSCLNLSVYCFLRVRFLHSKNKFDDDVCYVGFYFVKDGAFIHPINTF